MGPCENCDHGVTELNETVYHFSTIKGGNYTEKCQLCECKNPQEKEKEK